MSGQGEVTISVCPPGTPHQFKTVRTGLKTQGTHWSFFKTCTRCPAILAQIVNSKADEEGNVTVKASTYLITPGREPLLIA